MPRDTPPDARGELGAAWVRALYRWWEFYDREYVRGALRRPLIELGDGRTHLGQWDAAHRRIVLSRYHVQDDPWADVLDTLRHEMAHQYVTEVLRPHDEAAHGEAFYEACRRLRCEPRASGRHPQAAQVTARAEEERVVRLVKKLLSLADSPNEHEAQAAVNKAQQLLLEYNIDLVETDAERAFERLRLGPVKGRHAAWELWLAMILNEFFFVEVLWTRSYDAGRDHEGTVLEVYGTVTNLEMAHFVYDYLSQLLTRLWDDYRRRRGLDGNRERMRYYAGVLQGFHGKLTQQQQAGGTATSRALVWRGDVRLREYYRYHNPRVETRQSSGVAASEAFHHGVEEGRRVHLRRPLASSGSGLGGYLSR